MGLDAPSPPRARSRALTARPPHFTHGGWVKALGSSRLITGHESMTTTGASACAHGHDGRDRSAHGSPATARGMRPGSRRRYRAVLAAGVAIGMLLGAGDEAAWAG